MLSLIDDTNPPVAPPEPPKPKLRTITLTNRAPVQIDEDQWPDLAEGKAWNHDEQFSAEVSIRVRRRTDGGPHSYLVYAKYSYDTPDPQDWPCALARVGRVLSWSEAQSNLWKHICEVADELRERIHDADHKRLVTEACDRCFERLPPHRV